jgi:hypothetical protein
MTTSITEGGQALFQQRKPLDMLDSYQVELAHELLDEQGQLIDWLIGFAFDTLGARALDLRVVPSEPLHPIPYRQVGASARSVASRPGIYSTQA